MTVRSAADVSADVVSIGESFVARPAIQPTARAASATQMASDRVWTWVIGSLLRWRARRRRPTVRHAVYRPRSEEHTSELQSLMRITYAVLCLNKKKKNHTTAVT